MLKILLARARQGHRTSRYPKAPPALPARFRGPPVLGTRACPDGCQACVEACPTSAISLAGGEARVDLGRCLFCSDCEEACPQGAITHQREYRLGTRTREELVVGAAFEARRLALDAAMRRLFGRSLKLRQVSAGGQG